MPQVLDHTQAELANLIRQARVRRGEPEDGAECSDAEALRFARKVRRERERENERSTHG